jgi:hypothetical protein
MISITDALRDPALLGAALGPCDSWHAWLTILSAAFGELQDDDLAEFIKLAGVRKPPEQPVRELWAVAGRRGGKSRMAAAICCYLACFKTYTLAPGEKGFVLSLSPSKAQSALIKSYAEAYLTQSPVLSQQIEAITAEEIVLTGGITIGIHSSSFRTIRGRSLVGCVFDELAFWRDETSAIPDLEIYRAVKPSLDSTNGLLVGISSPYRKTGLLAAKHRDHYAKDSADVLVVQAATAFLNPTFSEKAIAQAYADDAPSASAEYGAEFRGDLQSLLSDDVIDTAIDYTRPLELPPQPGIKYVAFVDASAGRHDAFCASIGHVVEDESGNRTFICDVLRGREPPFHPGDVAREFADLARQYRISEITGDAFAGEWTAQAFRDAGISYRKSDLPKSQLYLEGLSTFNSGRVRLPNDAKLIRELRLLERSTHRSGKDSVDHPRGGNDDRANVVFGAMWVAGVAGSKIRGDASWGIWSHATGEIHWKHQRDRTSALSPDNGRNECIVENDPASRYGSKFVSY